MAEEIERVEKCFIDFGMERMSKYFGKKKKSPGGMFYHNLLWYGHDQYYYVSQEGEHIIIWCSRGFGTDLEKVDEFSCGLEEEEIQKHIRIAAYFILTYYRDILYKYIQFIDVEPDIYDLSDEVITDTLSVTGEGLYKIDIKKIIEDNTAAHQEEKKEIKTVGDVWDQLKEQIFSAWDRKAYETALNAAKDLHRLASVVDGAQAISAAYALSCISTTYMCMHDYMSSLTVEEEIFNMPVIREKDYIDFYEQCLSNLVHSADMAADFFTKEKYIQVYIDHCIERYGQDDDITLQAMLDSVGVRLITGKVKEAYYSAVNCYYSYRSLYGPDYEKTLDALYWIAKVYSFIGIHESALDIYSKIYTVCFTQYGENDERTLDSITSLAVALRYANRIEDSIALSYYVMIKTRRKFGADSEETMFAKYEHALNLLEDGKYGQARGYLLECRKQIESLDEDYELFRFDLLMALAKAEKDGKHKDVALKIYNELYEEMNERYGNYDTRTIRLLSSIIDLTYADDLEHTRSLLEKLYRIRCAVEGEKDIGTLGTLSNLSYINSMLGDHETALRLQTEAYETAKEVYGEFDETTMFFEQNLIIRINESGDFKAAYLRGYAALERRREYLGSRSEAVFTMRQLLSEIMKV